MIRLAKRWLEELGKFLLDVGKYVMTAVVISSILGNKTESWQWLVLAIVITIALVVLGLLLIDVADTGKSGSTSPKRYGTSRNRNNN